MVSNEVKIDIEYIGEFYRHQQQEDPEAKKKSA